MKYRNTSPTRSNALRPAEYWRMSSIQRAGIRRRSLSARASLLATPLPNPPPQGGREQIKSGIHGDYTLSSPLGRQRVRKAPGMAERVHDAGIARAPECIPRRHRDGRAGIGCALDRRVAVLDLEMHGDRCPLDLVGRKHRVHTV